MVCRLICERFRLSKFVHMSRIGSWSEAPKGVGGPCPEAGVWGASLARGNSGVWLVVGQSNCKKNTFLEFWRHGDVKVSVDPSPQSAGSTPHSDLSQFNSKVPPCRQPSGQKH